VHESLLLTLQFTSLAVERQHNVLFDGISGDLQSGEILQINGPNGSGKSTLLRILAGFLQPESGTILWKQNPITKNIEDYQQQLHYVGHHNALKHHLTLLENINLYCAFSKCTLPLKNILAILEKINLTHLLHSTTESLSAGQKRRLSLAKLLMNLRPLWILDEPATALDIHGQEILINLCHEHLQNGGMIALATHQPLNIGREKKEIRLGEMCD